MRLAYLHGRKLERLRTWAEEVAEISRNEPHLLPQHPDDLRKASRAGRVLIGIDRDADNRIFGGAVLWDLKLRTTPRWYELGTIFVIEKYRYSHGGIPISDNIYQRMLKGFPHVNILATTTNDAAKHAGERNGLVRILYEALPEKVRAATCSCPESKTGTDDNRLCQLRDNACNVRVSRETWERLGRPPQQPLVILKTRTHR